MSLLMWRSSEYFFFGALTFDFIGQASGLSHTKLSCLCWIIYPGQEPVDENAILIQTRQMTRQDGRSNEGSIGTVIVPVAPPVLFQTV